MSTLSEKERRVLIHALTGSNADGKAYRNYYFANENHHSVQEIRSLVEKRMMAKGISRGKDGCYYHATKLGCDAVGLPYV